LSAIITQQQGDNNRYRNGFKSHLAALMIDFRLINFAGKAMVSLISFKLSLSAKQIKKMKTIMTATY